MQSGRENKGRRVGSGAALLRQSVARFREGRIRWQWRRGLALLALDTALGHQCIDTESF
jgi:hypothetical protein